MTAYVVVRLLFAALGTLISGQFLWLVRTHKQNRQEQRSGYLLGTTTLVLYGFDLLSALVLALGASEYSSTYVVLCSLSFIAVAFMPPAVIFSWRHSLPGLKSGQTPRAPLFYSLLVAFLLSVLLIAGAVTRSSAHLLHAAVGAADLIVLSFGFRLFDPQALSSQLRLCLRICQVASAAGLSSLALAFVTRSVASMVLVFLAVQLLAVLLAVLAAFLFFARFRYADVFALRATRALALGLSSALCAAVLVRLLAHISSPAVSLLVLLGAVFAATWAAASYSPRLDSWVRTSLLHQADFKAELDRFSGAMAKLQNESELLQWVDTSLSALLSLSSSTTIAAEWLDPGVRAALCPFGDVLETTSTAPRVDSIAQPAVYVPVMVDNLLRYVTVIDPGSLRGPLLSAEVQFIRAIARQVAAHLRRIETAREMNERELRDSLLRSQVSEAELRALRAQIHPHFLFNSLNTIADLIATDGPRAERMTVRLAGVFRHVLRQSDRQTVTLAEEFDFLRSYLQIEQERFGDRLRTAFHLDPAIASLCIPTLLLQPLVENSLKHGLAPKKEGGSLSVRGRYLPPYAEISVTDDGVGLPGSPSFVASRKADQRSHGVGLTNTVARLRTTYGEAASLHVQSSENGGCSVTILLPLNGEDRCAA